MESAGVNAGRGMAFVFCSVLRESWRARAGVGPNTGGGFFVGDPSLCASGTGRWALGTKAGAGRVLRAGVEGTGIGAGVGANTGTICGLLGELSVWLSGIWDGK
jgi:hypothetical protein